jgi:ribose 5-phosphate isomerase B
VYYGEAPKQQIDADGKAIDIITSTRDHNNANALSLGGRFLSEEECKSAVKRFLELPFSKDARHERRIMMLDA